MIDVVPDMLKELERENLENTPDVLGTSSDILQQIFDEYWPRSCPDFVHPIHITDYFDEHVLGEHAISLIQWEWDHNKDYFEVFEKANELRWNAESVDESDITMLIRELPENLEIRRSRQMLILNLKEARVFFGIPFTKRASLFARRK